MTPDVPDVIARYLGLAATGDLDALLGCFADDAVVTDEGETYRGRDAIRRWRETVASKFTYTVDVVDAESPAADDYVVTARLDGNFPGSPVDLRFRFGVRDGLIAALEIAP